MSPIRGGLRTSAHFEALAIAAAQLDFGRNTWLSLANLGVLAALGWGIGVRPLGSRVSGLGAALAGIGCIVALAVGLALSRGPIEVLNRGWVAWSLARLLAFCAAAFSLGAQRSQAM